MAVKTKRNEYGDCFYNESDIIELIYQNPELDISKLYIEPVDQYMKALNELKIDLPTLQTQIKKHDNINIFDQTNIEQWHMPDQYKKIDVRSWLLDKCSNDIEKSRVNDEMKLFESKNFIKVLQFLIYFVDTLRANNIVWGVGRGSSVSSFCLFLIGVHKINPLMYDLDYREFLR